MTVPNATAARRIRTHLNFNDKSRRYEYGCLMGLGSDAVVFKVLGPAATVVCAGLIAGQNDLDHKGTKSDAKELKSDIHELRKDMHNMENKP